MNARFFFCKILTTLSEICNQKERAELLRRIYKAFFSKDDEEGFMTVVSGIKKKKAI